MPITELVIGSLKPEVAQDGLAAIRTTVPKIFNSVPGCINNRVGHIVKHNGKDVSSEYRPVLALEWNRREDFHAFFPASEAFQSFIGALTPYFAAKATPQLFKPAVGYERSNGSFEKGVAQIFIGTPGEKKDEVISAWDKLVKGVREESGDASSWSGWGVGDGEGTWTGVLALRGAEDFDGALKSESVMKALEELRNATKADEYLAKFE